LPIFDVESNWREILFIHAGIHGEDKRVVCDPPRQAVKAPIGLLLRVLPEQADKVGAEIYRAYDIARAPI
jgi:hypothetical protein